MNQKPGVSSTAPRRRAPRFSLRKADEPVALDWRTIHPVQLTPGPQTLSCRVAEIENGCLSRVEATQDASLLFRQPARSVVFSVRGQEGGFYLKSQRQTPHSLLVFSSPHESPWVGGLYKSGPGPLHGARAITTVSRDLELAPELLERGFIELPLPSELVREFFAWHDSTIDTMMDLRQRTIETHIWSVRFAQLANAAHRQGTPFQEIGPRESLATRVALAAQSAPLGSRFSVQDAATATKSSVRSVQRAFSWVLGTSYSTYALNLRLARARAELLKGGATVAAVAIESGFGHASRFAEQYRRLFGHNPSDVARPGYSALEVA